VAIVAIAADSVDDMASLQAKLPDLELLTDPGLATAHAWGLQAKDAEEPSPGTFVVDQTGQITYRRLEDASGDWPTYAEVAAAIH
jgi:peroxiredoxin